MKKALEYILLAALILLCFTGVVSSGVIRADPTEVCVPVSSERVGTETATYMEFMLKGFFKGEKTRLFVKKGIAVYNFDTGVTFCIYPILRGGEYVGVFDCEGGEAVISDDVSVCTALSRLSGGDYVLYVRGGEFCAQSEAGAVKLSGEGGKTSVEAIPVNMDYFAENSGIDLLNLCPIKGLKTVLSAVPDGESANVPDAEVRSCGIRYFSKQGELPLCWAASAATIVDHLAGKDYTAESIAERFGYPTDDGQDMDEALGIIRTYDRKYFGTYGKITWIRLKSLAANGYPFYMHLRHDPARKGDAASFHAIVGCGCFYAEGDAELTFVTAWNPQGNMIAFRYNAESFTVASNGKTYRWTRTLAR